MKRLPAPKPAASGLIAWLERTRIALPLKGVEVYFELRGDVLEVQIDQIYYQDTDRILDVTYTFPLPSGAAIYRCEMHVNDRVISAKILPIEEARKLVSEKKALGHHTGLVETVRENIFELGLGNLAPGDTVVIRLAYLQTLDRDGIDSASFRIPLTPGIRYITGQPLLRRNQGGGPYNDTDAVPDASRINPPRIDSLHQDSAYLSCEGTVDPMGWDPSRLTSPSHALLVQPHSGRENLVRVKLASHSQVPDRDIVVRFEPIHSQEVTHAAWCAGVNGHTYAIVRLVAPSPSKLITSARDFYFLIDRSGSMEGVKWNACCQAFREFLRSLSPLDRAWVTFFETGFQDLAEKPLPAAAILAEPVVNQLEELGTDGGTELCSALTHVLEKLDQNSAPERQPSLIIITDGQVGDEDRIHRLLHPHCGKLRVHTFGIDTAVNDAFLKQLANDHGGGCSLATPEDNIPNMVASLARKTGTAVATNLSFEEVWETPGQPLPALWEGDAITLPMRGSCTLPREIAVHGKSREGHAISWTIPVTEVNNPAPRLLWQRLRCQQLDREGQDKEAVALGCEANLLCQGTAFVAWDEAERIAVPTQNLPLYQPALIPSHSRAFHRLDAEPSFEELTCPPRYYSLNPAVYDPFEELIRSARSKPESAMLEPLISSQKHDSSWHIRLVKLLGISNENAVHLASWLEQWIWASPNQADKRKIEFRELLIWLARIPRTRRREEFLVWVKKRAESPIQEAIEKLMTAQ